MERPSEDDRELIDHARRIVEENGDDEVYTVGAAVRDARGRIFGGINVYHFTGGPCAELVALGHARASGARELTAIVAYADRERGVIPPCGRDRQVLLDYHPDIAVLVPTPDGIRRASVAELMPHAYVWTPDDGSQPGLPGRLQAWRTARSSRRPPGGPGWSGSTFPTWAAPAARGTSGTTVPRTS